MAVLWTINVLPLEMNCSGMPLYHNHHQTHSKHSDYQCHYPSNCSTYYCWEVRVRRGMLPLRLTLWITEWRNNNGTGAVYSQSQPLDCNCHTPGTPLFNVVHQLRAWGLCSSLQSGSECHFIRVRKTLKSTTRNVLQTESTLTNAFCVLLNCGSHISQLVL